MTMSPNGAPNAPGEQSHVRVDILQGPDSPGPRMQTALAAPESPTPKPAQMNVEELKAEEPDIVDALFAEHERVASQVAVIELPEYHVPQVDDDGKLVRDADGKVVVGPWRIRVRALHQEQIDQAERKSRRVFRPNEKGKRESTADPVELTSWIIYLGTVPEDRQRPGGWDDSRMWTKFKVGNGVDLIDKFLRVGDKTKIADAIRKLSNINMDEDLAGESSGAEEES